VDALAGAHYQLSALVGGNTSVPCTSILEQNRKAEPCGPPSSEPEKKDSMIGINLPSICIAQSRLGLP